MATAGHIRRAGPPANRSFQERACLQAELEKAVERWTAIEAIGWPFAAANRPLVFEPQRAQIGLATYDLGHCEKFLVVVTGNLRAASSGSRT